MMCGAPCPAAAYGKETDSVEKRVKKERNKAEKIQRRGEAQKDVK